mgnify:CR=1 FL=1
MQVRLLPGAQYFIQRQLPIIELPVVVGAQHKYVRRVVDLGERRVRRPCAERFHMRELDVDVVAAALAHPGSVAIHTATVVSDLTPSPRRVDALISDLLHEVAERRISPGNVGCPPACVARCPPTRPHEVCRTALLARQHLRGHAFRCCPVVRRNSAAPCAVLRVRCLGAALGTFSFHHNRIYGIARSIVKSCNPARTFGTVRSRYKMGSGPLPQ